MKVFKEFVIQANGNKTGDDYVGYPTNQVSFFFFHFFCFLNTINITLMKQLLESHFSHAAYANPHAQFSVIHRFVADWANLEDYTNSLNEDIKEAFKTYRYVSS